MNNLFQIFNAVGRWQHELGEFTLLTVCKYAQVIHLLSHLVSSEFDAEWIRLIPLFS